MAIKINGIELTNFRVYEHQAVSLGDRNLVIGENGTGKSSLIDAVAWCLTGRCRGVDGRGKGQLSLIRTDTQAMEVTVNLDGLGPITRTLDRNGSTSCTMKTDAILARLRTNEPMLQAVLYGQSFFGLHHADAKKLLLGLLDVKVDGADLPGLGIVGLVDLDELEARYKGAFDNRTLLKRQLTGMKEPVAPAVGDLSNLAQLQAAATEAGAAFQAAVKVNAKAQAAVDQATKAVYAANKQALPDREQLAAQVAIQHEGLGGQAAILKTALAAIAELEPKHEGDGLTSELQDLKHLQDRLANHDPSSGCVLSGGIPCRTAAAEFSGFGESLAVAMKGLDKRIKANEKVASKLAAERVKVRDAERQVAYHQTQISGLNAKLEGLDERRAEHEATVARLLADLDAAKANPDLGNGPVDEAAARQLAAHQAAADVGRQQAALDGYQRELQRYQQVVTDLTEAERVVALLGPKGAPATALQNALADFTDLINLALAGFGFRLQIQVEPFLVSVQSQTAGWRPFEMLSAGEQLWTGLAFQLALAVVSGLQFCALDAAEAVVGQNRAVLTGLVLQAPVGQVVVAMAKGAAEDSPVIDGLTVIRLEQEQAGVAS